MVGEGEKAGRPQSGFDARLSLVIYVRLLAVVFMASGLSRWASVLGITAPNGDFLALPGHQVAATVFFAVADLVAAVGLWLLAPWGAVVWMIDALTETALNTLFADVYGQDQKLVAFHIGSVLIYAVLTYIYERTRA